MVNGSEQPADVDLGKVVRHTSDSTECYTPI
jgi:hypothetical protein